MSVMIVFIVILEQVFPILLWSMIAYILFTLAVCLLSQHIPQLEIKFLSPTAKSLPFLVIAMLLTTLKFCLRWNI